MKASCKTVLAFLFAAKTFDILAFFAIF